MHGMPEQPRRRESDELEGRATKRETEGCRGAGETSTRPTGPTDERKDDTMAGIRVTATVVGNTLLLDQDVQLPDGARVEAELRLVENGEGVVIDDETAAELEQALKEADAGDFVTEEEVWAKFKARYGK
jgi:hypothetical protein